MGLRAMRAMFRRLTTGTEDVEGIPVRWVAPRRETTAAALWLTYLGGSAEASRPMLVRLARRGLLSCSFDPPGHGARSDGRPAAQLASEVLASFRQRMWPLLGQTVLDSQRVLDWMEDRFGVSAPHVAGGVSMGGDAAVALAGADHRIARVCSLIATPDWTRPGMRAVDGAPQVLAQGEADERAQRFFDAFNPMSHLDAYGRDVFISFQCGGADQQVPPEAALRFRDALVSRDPNAAGRVQVDLYEGLSHAAAGSDKRLTLAALDWLTRSGSYAPPAAGESGEGGIRTRDGA
jgi:uncharacterized protein